MCILAIEESNVLSAVLCLCFLNQNAFVFCFLQGKCTATKTIRWHDSHPYFCRGSCAVWLDRGNYSFFSCRSVKGVILPFWLPVSAPFLDSAECHIPCFMELMVFYETPYGTITWSLTLRLEFLFSSKLNL